MVGIKFYSKEGCWLCDTAEDLMNGLKLSHGLKIERVDINTDEELYELYRYDIPVLEFKDGSTLNGQIRKKELLRKIDENKE